MADQPLIQTPTFSSTHVFSTDDITGTFGGLTQGDIAAGELPIVNFSATPQITKEGVSLYPVDSEFGYYVTDFVGAEQKIRDYDYAEGWVGNLSGEGGEHIGLVVSDAETDTFQTPAVLGTWLSGLGGNSVKASTEHYSVMQQVLSDQMYPGDPDALYPLDNDLILVSQNTAWDGQHVSDLLSDPATYGVTDRNGDGTLDLKDLLNPNEATVGYDIAYSSDYSVTLKDDGKLLYRWGNMIKKPNDVRIETELDLPDEWKDTDAATELKPLFRITAAELVTDHTVTNNPNDQIRPEDFENEAAIGQLPTYTIVADYNEDGNGPREVWVTTDDYYAGDGTLYEAGTVLKDEYLAQQAAASDLNAITAADATLLEGYTNAWFTTMDREPFEADLDGNGDYITGPRWRLQPDKYGQDLPGVVIPLDPSLEPPVSHGEEKYVVGEDTTTVINLLDWGLPVSPLGISAGWQNNSGTASVNGLNMTENFDVAFYVKGDIKPATLYDATLLLNYEEITIHDETDVIAGGAEDDYLVGQGGNTFTGGAGSDLLVLSYGKSEGADFTSSTIADFTDGEDVIGLIDLGVTDVNFDTKVTQLESAGNLQISVDGDQIAELQGVTTELDLDDFLLINRTPNTDQTGTTGDDTLIGTAGDNLIDGGDGNDMLYGQSGSDTLLGGNGDDMLLAEIVNTEFDTPAGQMFRLYETAFDRSPDRAGHQDWTLSLMDGAQTLDAVSEAFTSSAEFVALYTGTTNEEFVTALYNNALDRAPDAAGLASWVALLDGGTLTRAEVMLGFSESLELQAKTVVPELAFSQAGYQQDFTDEAYRLMLATQDVEAVADALENTALDLALGETTADVAADLMTTAASTALYDGTTNTEFVEQLYQVVLNRAADTAGLASWTALLDGGTSRAEVLVGVAESTEAQTGLADDLLAHIRSLGEDDRLDGGAGDDALFGGILSDAFVFDAADAGTDQLVGLEAWDMLEFSGFGYGDAAAARAQMAQDGDDVVFSDSGVLISFLDTELSSITDDMISIL